MTIVGIGVIITTDSDIFDRNSTTIIKTVVLHTARYSCWPIIQSTRTSNSSKIMAAYLVHFNTYQWWYSSLLLLLILLHPNPSVHEAILEQNLAKLAETSALHSLLVLNKNRNKNLNKNIN